MRHRVPVALALILLVSACSTGYVPPPPPASVPPIDFARSTVQRALATDSDADAAADAVNAFGIDLYRLISAEGDDNLVLSPASVALALGMARAGARGDTAIEMDDVLYEVASDDNPNLLNSLDAALAERNGTFRDLFGEDGEVTLSIANATFAQRDFPLEAAFLDTLAERFGSGVQLVDYGTDPEAARRVINAWVSEQTEERIPELLKPDVLDELTQLTLVNAVYLQAPWHAAFEERGTRDASFTTTDGTSVAVPMMHTSTEFDYAAGDGWQAVELPYVGEQLAMTLIVPDDLAEFEAELDAARFAEVVSSLENRYVNLSMPRFSVETQTSLAELLKTLGMPSAFDPRAADFSGMTTESDGLHITDVIHQANIDVDEEGTEASAASAVIIGWVSSGPDDQVTMAVDRPFLFALRDTHTGAILFIGRVTNPSS
jgi:serpin B